MNSGFTYHNYHLNVKYSDSISSFFFFNDTATTEIYTLSLHDALPIYAFLGSESFGELLDRYSNIKQVVFGHTHRRFE